jgi:hypothetical protein
LSAQRLQARASQRAASVRSQPQQSMQCSSTADSGWVWARSPSCCQRVFQRRGRSRLGISANGSKPAGGAEFRRLRSFSPQGMGRADSLVWKEYFGVIEHPFDPARPPCSIQAHARVPWSREGGAACGCVPQREKATRANEDAFRCAWCRGCRPFLSLP